MDRTAIEALARLGLDPGEANLPALRQSSDVATWGAPSGDVLSVMDLHRSHEVRMVSDAERITQRLETVAGRRAHRVEVLRTSVAAAADAPRPSKRAALTVGVVAGGGWFVASGMAAAVARGALIASGVVAALIATALIANGMSNRPKGERVARRASAVRPVLSAERVATCAPLIAAPVATAKEVRRVSAQITADDRSALHAAPRSRRRAVRVEQAQAAKAACPVDNVAEGAVRPEARRHVRDGGRSDLASPAAVAPTPRIVRATVAATPRLVGDPGCECDGSGADGCLIACQSCRTLCLSASYFDRGYRGSSKLVRFLAPGQRICRECAAQQRTSDPTSAVYAAELAAFGPWNMTPRHGDRLDSRRAAEQFAARLLTSSTWRSAANGADASAVSFAELPATRGAEAVARTVATSPSTVRIELPPELFIEWMVCHEVAHAARMLGHDDATHGDPWQDVYARLLRSSLGAAAASAFEKSFA